MNAHRHDFPWISDQGDGTYRNPVLHADYSDPDVIRVGEDFYLTSSSFNCVPGLPILHSRDLVNWTLVNHALRELPHPRYAEVQPGQGVWAPSIRHHDGRFWIFFPTPDEGIYVTTAVDPAGEWSKPHLLLRGKGLIDPCPLWDDDGKAYVIYAYAGSRSGIRNKLHLRPMSPCGTKILGEGKIVAEIHPGLPALEGPKLHKLDGWYYISAPSGGVASGWQVIFRSRDIQGPYEEKIVLSQRGSEVNGPHQGALVDTPKGEWWFLHFQDKGLYGRIVHLQPVRWVDGWPLIGEAQDRDGVGRPVMRHAKPDVGDAGLVAVPQTSDDFKRRALGLQWQWQGNPESDWYSLAERPDHLTLKPRFVLGGDLRLAPNLLLQKFPAEEFTVETCVDLSPASRCLHAGLLVAGVEYAALDVVRGAEGYEVRQMNACEGGEVVRVNGPTVTLQVKVGVGGVCRFGIVQAGGDFYQIGPAFHAKAGKWIGAKVGLYCITTDVLDASGSAAFPYFRFLSSTVKNGHETPAILATMNGNGAGRPASREVEKSKPEWIPS
ncbi:glycoside hydrolase 43 family protein [Luteolibacter sp. LG18]|uniref:glycoside hydrolase family 43 protein n=1 Tax=Luteolibacter sp. LG18 TaxID=2819286 RepID=UPI002B285922|nr:glycoside hydrolase [Luteolibacter sp. LG18]